MAASTSTPRWMRGLLAAGALALLAAPACSGDDEKDVRYEPSSPAVVQAMLEMARAGPDDVLYDLGSGDGRIAIAAARDFGVREATGIEIDRELIEESRRNAQDAGVADRVRFLRADLFSYDFSDADVVTLFLLPRLNIRLRTTLLSELEPGTRVVSHEHGMGEWQPDEHRSVDGHAVYLWIIPARAEGTWTWTHDGARYRLNLQQQFQRVSGTLEWRGRHVATPNVDLRGSRLRFTAPGGDDRPPLRFEGRIEGETLKGTLHRGGERMAMTAERAG